MNRSILVDLCALMFLTVGAWIGGNVLGTSIADYMRSGTDRVEAEGKRRLAEFRRQQAAELAVAAERDRIIVEAMSEGVRRAYDRAGWEY